MQVTSSILKTVVSGICIFTVYVLIMITVSIRQNYFPEFITKMILYLSYTAMGIISTAALGVVSIVFYHWYHVVREGQWETYLMLPGLISDIFVLSISFVLIYLAYYILTEGV